MTMRTVIKRFLASDSRDYPAVVARKPDAIPPKVAPAKTSRDEIADLFQDELRGPQATPCRRGPERD